jgi:DNA polymerase-1
MERYLLIDGLNLAYRCFFAVPQLTNQEGLAVNALQGWMRALWNLEDYFHPQGAIIFFDQGRSVQRRALLETYKANRPTMPEALCQQLSPAKELARYMGYALHAQEGIEADDLIASTAQCCSSSQEIFIASADKDLAQCIAKNVSLLRPSSLSQVSWEIFDAQRVKQHWGIEPAQMVDYLALVGDVSDNIPGIPGIGPKTAQKWLQSFATIEGIYSHLGQISPIRFAKLLPLYRGQLEMNRKLIQLDRTLPVSTPLNPLRPQGEPLVTLLQKLGLTALAVKARSRYGKTTGQLSFNL